MNLRLFGIRPTSVGHLPSSETGLVKNSTYHCFPLCIFDLPKSLHPGMLAFCESPLLLKYSKRLIYKGHLLQSLISEIWVLSLGGFGEELLILTMRVCRWSELRTIPVHIEHLVIKASQRHFPLAPPNSGIETF